MIKMIAMDFDWTLLDHSQSNLKQRVNKEIIQKLNNFIKNGGHAGIVSGRPYWDFENEFKIMGIDWGNPFPDFVVAREAYIYQIKNGKYIENTENNISMRKQILKFNVSLAKYIDELYSIYQNHGIDVNNFILYGDYVLEIHTKLEDADKSMAIASQFIEEKKIPGASVCRNCDASNIYYKYAGKGNSLLKSAEMFGIEPEEILAIGDNYNDITMIDGNLGFIGACVGNADDNIKNIVINGGGYVGVGTAYKGILDVLKQVNKNEKILNFM